MSKRILGVLIAAGMVVSAATFGVTFTRADSPVATVVQSHVAIGTCPTERPVFVQYAVEESRGWWNYGVCFPSDSQCGSLSAGSAVPDVCRR